MAQNCSMCFDPDKLNLLLAELVEELQKRKILFTESHSANLDDYNTKNNKTNSPDIFLPVMKLLKSWTKPD